MEFIISGQTLIFLISCLLGGAFSLVYDVFRILRITVKTGKIMTAFEDVLFFIITAVATFVFFLRFTEGMVRFYVLAGELLGFAVCHLTASAVIVKTLGFVIRMVKRAIAVVKIKLVTPIVKQVFSFTHANCKFFVNKAAEHRLNRKKDLKSTGEIMYNHTKHSKKAKAGGKMSKTKRKSRKKNIVIALIVLALAAYAIVSLTVSGARIAEERNNISYLEAQKKELETQAKEYDRLTDEYDKQVKNGETIEYAEKIAREKLSLVSPDERVWIDIAGS